MKRKSNRKPGGFSIFGSKGARDMSEAFLNMAADDEADLAEFDRTSRLNDRFGPCEDDYELTAPFVDLLPEEAYDKEGPSPLRF